MLLVSSGSYLSLYRIPELRPVHDDSSSDPVDTVRLAAQYPCADAVDDNQIWDMLCPHFDGRIASYTFSEEDALIILPPPGESADECVRYVVDGPCSMGYSRAIGSTEWIDQQPMRLECFNHYTRSDGHAGYRRLGHSAPHPLHTVSISLLGQDGRADDLSWDEESGRISVIFSPFDNRESREMLLVYMIS